MISLLFMVLVCAAVWWLAAAYVGKLWGTVIGVLTFVAWGKFNQGQGTTGLFKSNFKAYFHFRRAGQSVDEALQSMIASRYWFSEEKRQRMGFMVSAVPQEASEQEKVTTAVFMVFCSECGEPPDQLKSRYLTTISEIYSHFDRQHRLPQ